MDAVANPFDAFQALGLLSAGLWAAGAPMISLQTMPLIFFAVVFL